MKQHTPMVGVLMMAAGGMMAHGAPNFVFVTIDDLSRASMGIHGCTVPGITPQMDQLGYSAMRFEHCHVQSANCTPSRAIISTGMYQQNNRVFGLGKEGAGNHRIAPAIPDIFRAAGYHTGLMGKNSHMSPFDPYSGFDVEYDTYGSTRDPLNVYGKLTTAFADAAGRGKPLYFNLNIFDPHVGWYGWDHKEGLVVPETGNHPSTLYAKDDVPYPAWFPPLNEAERMGASIDGTQTNSMMVEVAAYYNTVKRADDSIGAMMRAIQDAGQIDNTIIVLVSDHGVQLPGAKTQLYDHSTRSPLFVKWPGVTSPNTVNTTHMIAAFDLLPTFCEMIGQPIPTGLDGRSFAPLLKGEAVSKWRDYVYKQQNDRNNMRAIQTADLLYIFNPWADGIEKVSTVATEMHSWRRIRAATNPVATAYADFFEYRTLEELYDVANDPHCRTNLFDNPAYAAQLAGMQARMEREMIESGDRLVLSAFTNRASRPAINQYLALHDAERAAQANDPNYTRNVAFDPHDDWMVIDHTIFEPAGEWGIWTPEGAGVSLNTSKGHVEAGPNCIQLGSNGVCRVITSRAIDTSVFTQLKLDIRIAAENLVAGNTLAFQYNDGTGWQDFQTLNHTQIAGDHNLVFELPGGGLPDTMRFGIKGNFGTNTAGRIYLDHARLTGWQDWADAPANAPFDASQKGILRLSFDFKSEHFSDSDKLLLEYFDGASWVSLKEYDFGYVLLSNKTYWDVIEIEASAYTFPTNLAFRFRSESTGSGQSFTVSNLDIKTRVVPYIPPAANPDSFSETAPKAIVVPAPGILANDVSGSAGPFHARLVNNVSHGILEFYPDGSFVYAATNGYTGPDSFTYVAANGSDLSAPTTVSLAINDPTAVPNTIFFDDFETGEFATGGWVTSGANATNTMAAAKYNGSYGANMRNGGHIIKTVSTEGYTNIQVSYWRRAEALVAPEAVKVAWSTNGTTWSDIETTQDINWFRSQIGLPMAAEGQPNLSVRFKVDSNLNVERAYYDDVLITGNRPAAVVTSFTNWATVHGVAADASRLLDYAFNINPYLTTRYTLPEGPGNSGLPLWKFSPTEPRLVVEFVRRKQATDLTYKAQFADSLTNWVDATSAETIVPIDAEFERVSVPDNATNATRRFGRVIVVQE